MAKSLFIRTCTVASAALVWFASASRAEAQRPSGYVLLSPAALHLPMGDEDFADQTEPGYGWGIAGGVLLRGKGPLTLGVGLGIDQQLINWDGDIDRSADLLNCNLHGSILRVAPEARIGASNRHVFGYGIFAPGIAAAIYNNSDCKLLGQPIFADRTDIGLHLKLGGGAQFYFSDHFGLGAEATAMLGFLNGNENRGGDYGVHEFDMRLMAAFRF